MGWEGCEKQLNDVYSKEKEANDLDEITYAQAVASNSTQEGERGREREGEREREGVTAYNSASL